MNYPPRSRRSGGRSVFKRLQTENYPCKVQCDCKLKAAFKMSLSPKLNAICHDSCTIFLGGGFWRTALLEWYSTAKCCGSCSCVASKPIYLAVDWTWMTNRMVFAKFRYYVMWFIICGVWPKRKSADQNQEHVMYWNNISEILSSPFLWLLKKSVEPVSFSLHKYMQNVGTCVEISNWM